jgi:hypothetical protein
VTRPRRTRSFYRDRWRAKRETEASFIRLRDAIKDVAIDPSDYENVHYEPPSKRQRRAWDPEF